MRNPATIVVLTVLTPPKLKGKFRLAERIITIGRAAESTVRIDSRAVAPVHASLIRDGSGHVLIDHSSKSGTFVDGVRVNKASIKPGARIRLGKHIELLFETVKEKPKEQIDERVQLATDQARGPISDIHKKITLEEAGFDHAREPSKMAPDAEVQKRHLAAIYQINQAMTEIFSLDGLAGKALDLIFNLFPIDRGAVLLYDHETGNPYPLLFRTQEGVQETGEISISRTVVGKAIFEKSAVLATDTYFDERFRNVSSIMQKQIRSVMCVPLHTRGKILGALYADSLEEKKSFSEEDLCLLFAIGGAIANSIENTSLIEQITDDERRLSTLERYLPATVVEHVIGRQDAIELGGKKRDVSVLFADIRDFTFLTERTEPDSVVRLLNEYFSAMAEVIFEYGGTLGEYIGDEIMAYFGAPLDCADHPARAIEVALKLKERIRSLRKCWEKAGSPVFSIGIGIATGPVIAGNVGSTKQMKYTVIGHTVNLASRLCSHARPGQILISSETYEASASPSNAVSSGTVSLKGISEPVGFYEIIQ